MNNNNHDFFKKINEAFAKSDTDFLLANVTDDITWTVIGDFTVNGKEEFEAMLKKMESANSSDLHFKSIITEGNLAAVEGSLKMTDTSGGEKIYAFCDIYKLDDEENGKIKEMTSYVAEVKNNFT